MGSTQFRTCPSCLSVLDGELADHLKVCGPGSMLFCLACAKPMVVRDDGLLRVVTDDELAKIGDADPQRLVRLAQQQRRVKQGIARKDALRAALVKGGEA